MEENEKNNHYRSFEHPTPVLKTPPLTPCVATLTIRGDNRFLVAPSRMKKRRKSPRLGPLVIVDEDATAFKDEILRLKSRQVLRQGRL